MIRVVFTMDSKRFGVVLHVHSLIEARRAIRCDRPVFTPERVYGFPKAWEVTCGDTVVADAMRLPKGAGEDYCPRYSLRKKKRKKRVTAKLLARGSS